MRTSYTEARFFRPITEGENIGFWESGQTFNFFENYDKTGNEIIVQEGDLSNGADVPPPWTIFLLTLALSALLSWFFGPFRISTHLWVSFSLALTTAWLLPRVHAEYIEAVFIHDVGLKSHRHLSRAIIDKIFFRALRVTTKHRLDTDLGKGSWRLLRPYVLYFGVAVFGIVKEQFGYFKPKRLRK